MTDRERLDLLTAQIAKLFAKFEGRALPEGALRKVDRLIRRRERLERRLERRLRR